MQPYSKEPQRKSIHVRRTRLRPRSSARPAYIRRFALTSRSDSLEIRLALQLHLYSPPPDPVTLPINTAVALADRKPHHSDP